MAADGSCRRLSVFDSNSKPPRNSTRESLRRGRTVFITKRTSRIEECWASYCNSTALHGVRYFVGGQISAYEKVLWMVLVVLCLGISIRQIVVVYGRWDSSPPFLSVAASTPSWEVPFPAVSICPRNATSKFGLHICYRADGGMATSDCVRKLTAATPALSDVVASGSWNGSPLDLTRQGAFVRVLSDEGFCYTFNMLNATDVFSELAVQHGGGGTDRSNTSVGWTLEEGYPTDSPWNAFPRRAIGNSVSGGLHLTIRGEDRFKVVLHSPIDMPIVGLSGDYVFRRKETAAKIQSGRHAKFYPVPDEEAVISVEPTMTTASTALLAVAPLRRQCFFPTERKLSFFQVYTQRNCELECIANITAKICDCAAVYMPRLKGQAVCPTRACYPNVTANDSDPDCGCLPECVSIRYDTRATHYSWQREYGRPAADGLANWTGLSRISIQIKDTTFTAIRLSASYSRPEFLADCGGLLVLFSGFSLISIVEVVFHLMIKWWCRCSK